MPFFSFFSFFFCGQGLNESHGCDKAVIIINIGDERASERERIWSRSQSPRETALEPKSHCSYLQREFRLGRLETEGNTEAGRSDPHSSIFLLLAMWMWLCQCLTQTWLSYRWNGEQRDPPHREGMRFYWNHRYRSDSWTVISVLSDAVNPSALISQRSPFLCSQFHSLNASPASEVLAPAPSDPQLAISNAFFKKPEKKCPNLNLSVG